MQSSDGSVPGRSDRQRRLAGLAPSVRWGLIGLVCTLVFLYLLVEPRLESDTQWLVHEALTELDCLRSGQWVGCKGPASQFPFFQVGPAILLSGLGLDPDAIVWIFAYFSIFCFMGSLWLIHKTLSPQSPWLARCALLSYLGSYAIRYSHSSFTEMAASALALAVVACELLGASPWLTAGALFLGALSKETAPPFLVALALLASWVRSRQQSLPLRPLVASRLPALGLSAIAAVAAHAGFNFFKFGGAINHTYLQPHFFVPDRWQQLSFFLGQWLSPTSGIWISWPMLAALFPLLAWRLSARETTARDTSRARWLSFAGVSLLLLALTAGFSQWFAPFGWIAWGPRLMLPWLPAALLLLMADYGQMVRSSAARLAARPYLASLLGSLFALSAFANFRVLIYRLLEKQVLRHPVCNLQATIEANPVEYYQCAQALTWPWPEAWAWLRVFTLQESYDTFILATIYSVLWLAFAKKLLAESPSPEKSA
jgi:hypothetical protein